MMGNPVAALDEVLLAHGNHRKEIVVNINFQI